MPKEQFLIAMRFLASSVSVVSAKDSDGKLYAMTASSVTSLTIEPPSILVCVNKGASIHDILIPGIDLCINILSKDQQDISNLCSSKDSESLRFANDFWNTGGVPFLKDAQSNIFSQVDEVISYNSHSIIIAKVLQAQSADSFDGLIYADGGYLA
ncbi:flavin reductase family protein [Gammaproteobacteria bacterium]|jgi:flavin reductase (DIM6/NTAB) family NADH-FMN oxidoreductase RutF|nr:flavin reductase family protein [Gammaproteobacteria bacterium]|tara:strand:- start:881 stop:1345 length:465 start_codon:yes stop_codon:yes gene_type:complete